MSHPSFCRQCGTPLKPNSQFCPRCGKVVTTVLPPTPEALQQPQAPPQAAAQSGTLWGIDKRILLLALVLLILVLPIFPREKIVNGTTSQYITITNTSYAYQTVTQPAQQEITVVVGNMRQVPQGSSGPGPCYWDPRYGWICPYYGGWGYGGWSSSCNNWRGTTQIVIDVSDRIVKYDQVNEPGGTWTITTTSYSGQTQVYRGVCSLDLTYTGKATVQTTQIVVNTQTIPNVQVQQETIPTQQVVIEHVSLLQILLGY
jgi:hypothetical protein